MGKVKKVLGLIALVNKSIFTLIRKTLMYDEL